MAAPVTILEDKTPYMQQEHIVAENDNTMEIYNEPENEFSMLQTEEHQNLSDNLNDEYVNEGEIQQETYEDEYNNSAATEEGQIEPEEHMYENEEEEALSEVLDTKDYSQDGYSKNDASDVDVNKSNINNLSDSEIGNGSEREDNTSDIAPMDVSVSFATSMSDHQTDNLTDEDEEEEEEEDDDDDEEDEDISADDRSRHSELQQDMSEDEQFSEHGHVISSDTSEDEGDQVTVSSTSGEGEEEEEEEETAHEPITKATDIDYSLGGLKVVQKTEKSQSEVSDVLPVTSTTPTKETTTTSPEPQKFYEPLKSYTVDKPEVRTSPQSGQHIPTLKPGSYTTLTTTPTAYKQPNNTPSAKTSAPVCSLAAIATSMTGLRPTVLSNNHRSTYVPTQIKLGAGDSTNTNVSNLQQQLPYKVITTTEYSPSIKTTVSQYSHVTEVAKTASVTNVPVTSDTDDISLGVSKVLPKTVRPLQSKSTYGNQDMKEIDKTEKEVRNNSELIPPAVTANINLLDSGITTPIAVDFDAQTQRRLTRTNKAKLKKCSCGC